MVSICDPNVENKAVMFHLTISVQQSTRSPSQYNKARKKVIRGIQMRKEKVNCLYLQM